VAVGFSERPDPLEYVGFSHTSSGQMVNGWQIYLDSP
jgi:hypothetical protein